MKKLIAILVASVFVSLYFTIPSGSGYSVGDMVKDFEAMGVDGKVIGTKNFPDAKGFVIVFTCNTCPYAQMYEDRINELSKKLDDKYWPLIAINSNDKNMSPGDAFDKMKARSTSHTYSFPYLYDESQSIVQAFGATKTPHFYVLNAAKTVKYIGAMDDNAENPANVKNHFVEDAIKALSNNFDPNPSFTRAIGCGIKKRTT